MKYIIGIDIGTSNTKAVAFTLEGRMVASASKAYATLPSESGHHEQDPEALLEACIASTRAVTTQLNTDIVAALSFSCAMHSLMAVDATNKPITPVITWADNRSMQYAIQLRQMGIANTLTLRTGTPVHPMSPLCKLMWMKDHAPQVFRQAAKFISIKEFIFFHLFGRYVIDHSMASATGLFNIHTKKWDEESLQLAGINGTKLAEPVPTSSIFSGMDAALARAMGIDRNVQVVIGATDGCLATLGSNASKEGDCALTIGTSGAVRMLSDKPQRKFDTLFNYILDDQQFVAGGPINNGGIVLKWYAENFLNRKVAADTDMDWFAKDAAKVSAGADGLLFLPYLLGERAPVWDAQAKAVFFGIHASHKQQHFMRAIIEGICFALLQVMELLEKSIVPAQKIYCSGGFTKSPDWLQCIADVFGKPMIVTSTGDASARGAAMLGWKALGMVPSFQEGGEKEIVYQPDATKHAVYEKLFPIYCSLYDALKSQFTLLHVIS